MSAVISPAMREATTRIGARIRHARRLRGLSQEALAAGIGITFQQVQKYENGANRVSACVLQVIADKLGFDVAYFMPSSTAPVGRAELDELKAQLAETLASFDRAADQIEVERERLRAMLARFGEPAAPQLREAA